MKETHNMRKIKVYNDYVEFIGDWNLLYGKVYIQEKHIYIAVKQQLCEDCFTVRNSQSSDSIWGLLRDLGLSEVNFYQVLDLYQSKEILNEKSYSFILKTS
jgi:hypothetical protein